MTDFKEWKNFNYEKCLIQLWVFKKSTSSAMFRALHVRTDKQFEDFFRKTIISEVNSVTEKIPYSHLSQNNENSCMEHNLSDSQGLNALLKLVNAPEGESDDPKVKQIKNSSGYLVKFQKGSEIVYGVRKTGPAWKSKKRVGWINAFFSEGELSVIPDESFTFDSIFDFFQFKKTIFIKSKRAYESMVSDKMMYVNSFSELMIEPKFMSLFIDLKPLKEYVGANSMHLRRMVTVKEKALYENPHFLTSLQEVSLKNNWGLNFSKDGKIKICDLTVRIVIQTFLDHRLRSEVTKHTYDVPNAEVV